MDYTAGTGVPLGALIDEAQADTSNDSRAMTAILGRFEHLALSIGFYIGHGGPYHDDLANAARWALVQAVRAHKSGTEGFPAYAKQYMRGAALRRLRELKDSNSVLVEDVTVFDRVDSDTTMIAVDERLAFVATLQGLSPIQHELAMRRYVLDEPLSSIATRLGVSVSAVSQRISAMNRRLTVALNGQPARSNRQSHTEGVKSLMEASSQFA